MSRDLGEWVHPGAEWLCESAGSGGADSGRASGVAGLSRAGAGAAVRDEGPVPQGAGSRNGGEGDLGGGGDMAQDAWHSYLDCTKRADTNHQKFLEFMEEFVRTHPGITLLQLGDLMQLKGIGELEGLTPKEKFSLWMRIDNDNHRTEWCETSYQAKLKIMDDVDREIKEIERRQPQMLYVVP